MKGEVLEPKVIFTVGSSTFIGGSCSGSVEDDIVSPICMFSRPVIATISPTDADGDLVLFIPSYVKTFSMVCKVFDPSIVISAA